MTMAINKQLKLTGNLAVSRSIAASKNRGRINHVLNVVRVEHALNVADELWPSKKPLNQQVGSISANKCIEGVVYTPASLWSSKNWRPWQQGRHQCVGHIDGDIFLTKE